MAAEPSMDLRRSMLPQARYIRSTETAVNCITRLRYVIPIPPQSTALAPHRWLPSLSKLRVEGFMAFRLFASDFRPGAELLEDVGWQEG